MDTSCLEGYPSSLALLEDSLVTVLSSLLDCYWQLLSIDIVGEESCCCEQLIGWLDGK